MTASSPRSARAAWANSIWLTTLNSIARWRSKFLHEEFSKDADKLNRFVQEAKAALALNHSNILTVHQIGEVDGKNYIATELITATPSVSISRIKNRSSSMRS